MSRRVRAMTGIALVVVLAALLALGAAFAGGGTQVGPFVLEGDQEVPGPGDPNGFGFAELDLDVAAERVCFILEWSGIRRPFAAHIHRGQAGNAGPIRVTLFSARRPLPGTIHHVEGCVRGVDSDLVDRIIANPDRYYVNIHNVRYPGGAIRGQLDGPTPV